MLFLERRKNFKYKWLIAKRVFNRIIRRSLLRWDTFSMCISLVVSWLPVICVSLRVSLLPKPADFTGCALYLAFWASWILLVDFASYLSCSYVKSKINCAKHPVRVNPISKIRRQVIEQGFSRHTDCKQCRFLNFQTSNFQYYQHLSLLLTYKACVLTWFLHAE